MPTLGSVYRYYIFPLYIVTIHVFVKEGVYEYCYLTSYTGKEYFLSSLGSLCTATIKTKEECSSEKVGATVGATFMEWSENNSKAPKGCYTVYMGKTIMGIWWNSHETGSPNPHSRQVCVAGTHE